MRRRLANQQRQEESAPWRELRRISQESMDRILNSEGKVCPNCGKPRTRGWHMHEKHCNGRQ